jgi:hypothetical protein
VLSTLCFSKYSKYLLTGYWYQQVIQCRLDVVASTTTKPNSDSQLQLYSPIGDNMSPPSGNRMPLPNTTSQGPNSNDRFLTANGGIMTMIGVWQEEPASIGSPKPSISQRLDVTVPSIRVV